MIQFDQSNRDFLVMSSSFILSALFSVSALLIATLSLVSIAGVESV